MGMRDDGSGSADHSHVDCTKGTRAYVYARRALLHEVFKVHALTLTLTLTFAGRAGAVPDDLSLLPCRFNVSKPG